MVVRCADAHDTCATGGHTNYSLAVDSIYVGTKEYLNVLQKKTLCAAKIHNVDGFAYLGHD